MKAVRFYFSIFFTLWLTACAAPQTSLPVEINLVALNDFHGYLQASALRYTDPDNPDILVTMEAGGIATLGGLLADLREQDPQLIFVGVGDLIGASPPLSAMWADEPSLEAMNLLGMRVSTLGNHELDEGKDELLRQINGGCESARPQKACQFSSPFSGTQFPYIAANVIAEETGKPLVAPYVIETVQGIKIAFVGAQVEDLAAVVSASSMAGIQVLDEADGINNFVPAMKRDGADIIIALVHQGGTTPAAFNQPDCNDLDGEIVDIVERLDPAVDLVLSAHTHQAYLCLVGNRSVSQAGSYGKMVTHVTLTYEPQAQQLLNVQSQNLIVDPRKYAPDPRLLALQKEVESRSKAVLLKPVARIGAPVIDRTLNRAGESAMGDVVADAQLAATAALGAQFALMNTGGIRSELIPAEPGAPLTYSQVAAVHPFKGTLQLVTLTGAQLKDVLEQQWQSDDLSDFRPLQISHSLSYHWSAARPRGNRVLTETITVNGLPVEADKTYRVVVNEFLADGGDGFAALRLGHNRVDTDIADLQALIDYLIERDAAGQPAGQQEPGRRMLRIE